jgi:hypothetical protein
LWAMNMKVVDFVKYDVIVGPWIGCQHLISAVYNRLHVKRDLVG